MGEIKTFRASINKDFFPALAFVAEGLITGQARNQNMIEVTTPKKHNVCLATTTFNALRVAAWHDPDPPKRPPYYELLSRSKSEIRVHETDICDTMPDLNKVIGLEYVHLKSMDRGQRKASYIGTPEGTAVCQRDLVLANDRCVVNFQRLHAALAWMTDPAFSIARTERGPILKIKEISSLATYNREVYLMPVNWNYFS